jgi:hypothetical protein
MKSYSVDGRDVSKSEDLTGSIFKESCAICETGYYRYKTFDLEGIGGYLE